MSDPVTVRVFDIVGSPLAVTATAGHRVYEKLAPLLRDGTLVVLSFEGIEMLIPTFLNAAIGQLYSEFSEERIRELLSVRDMDESHIGYLIRVVDNAKRFLLSSSVSPGDSFSILSISLRN